LALLELCQITVFWLYLLLLLLLRRDFLLNTLLRFIFCVVVLNRPACYDVCRWC